VTSRISLAGGLLLIALWVAALAWALSIGANCGTDCGDNGRGAFIGLVAGTPLGAGGLRDPAGARRYGPSAVARGSPKAVRIAVLGPPLSRCSHR
jgi:hypothetical protein